MVFSCVTVGIPAQAPSRKCWVRDQMGGFFVIRVGVGSIFELERAVLRTQMGLGACFLKEVWAPFLFGRAGYFN